MNIAKSKEDIRTAISIFTSLNGYKDSNELKEKCIEKEDGVHKDELLNKAVSRMAENTVEAYADAIALLSNIKGWKNADELKRECEEKSLALIKAAEAEKKKGKKLLIATIAGVVGAVVLAVSAVIIIGVLFGKM